MLGRTLLMLAIATAVVTPVAAMTAPATPLWVPRAEARAAVTGARTDAPVATHRTFAFAPDRLRALLDAAARSTRGIGITLPLPDGRLVRMLVTDSPVLGPDLQRALPDFHSYVARGLDDARITARLDLSRLGLHAIVLAPEGTAYLQPPADGAVDAVMSYWTEDDAAASAPFECASLPSPAAPGYRPASSVRMPAALAGGPAPASPRLVSSGDTLRTYRYVLTASGEFTKHYGGGDTLAAMAQLATVANLVNAVYERDLDIHLQLVWAKAFADSATDPFPTPHSLMPDLNVATIDSLFGIANYDIGQVLDYSSSGFTGSTYIPSVCWDGYKAGSWISGGPLGSEYYRVVMHEMGHMFGTDHLMDAPCQRNGPVHNEPGSGTTIMARAGRCAPYNVQPFCDHYFDAWSIVDIDAYVHAIEDCAVRTATGNTPPTADAGADHTIPRGTPFVLTGRGSDPDPGDTLTYCWEQFDTGPAYNDAVLGPLFRSQLPSTSPTRFLPAAATVLANTSDPWEKLPTVDRQMKFVLMVRDNHPGAGGQAVDSTSITVSGTPFFVTSPNGGESLDPGVGLPVTWTVGGGSVAPNVDILLSLDSGLTWTVLKANTPNDGSETVPFSVSQTRSACRIKVQAAGNIFYDVSNADFTLLATSAGAPLETPPLALALHPARPNPSAGSTTLAFDLPAASDVDLTVYAAPGAHVRTLVLGPWPAGRHTVAWDGRDDGGRAAGPGVYFVRLQAAGRSLSERILRVR